MQCQGMFLHFATVYTIYEVMFPTDYYTTITESVLFVFCTPMHTTAKQILESIPQRFRPEKAQGYNTVFHFDITGNEVLQYTVTINNGRCNVQQSLIGTADCTVTTSADTYIALETGKSNPQMALMTGKVKVSNIAAMMQFSKAFRKWDVGSLIPDRRTVEAPSLSSQALRPTKQGPLAGVKVLDFTRLLPGPLATMFLADMGADVIKIEDPDNPDYIRDFEPRSDGMSILYLSLNRSKRSMALNYLSAEGKQVVLDMVKNADVLIEQYRPGVMAQMGFGYEQLKQINPRLIYISITGYGQQSNMAMAAGHDLNYIAIAGALGITGTSGGAPVIPGFQLADIAGGSYMAMNAVMAALYQREKTGKGEWVDVSMVDAALPLSALQFAYHQGTKQGIGRGQYELSGGLANYNVYQCADGKYIALGSLEPKFWNKFCTKAAKPEWQDAFVKKGEALGQLKQQVAAFFVTKTRTEWIELFAADDICLTVVNDLEDLENDAYLNERGMFVQNEHPAVGKYKTINQPLKFKETTFDNNWNAPELGSDSVLVLKELHYTNAQIDALRAKGVVKTI